MPIKDVVRTSAAIKDLDRDIVALSQRLALGRNQNRDLNYMNAEQRILAFRKAFGQTLDPEVRIDLENGIDAPFQSRFPPMVATTLEGARVHSNKAVKARAGKHAVFGYDPYNLWEGKRTGSPKVGWFPRNYAGSTSEIVPVDEGMLPPSTRVKNILSGPRKRMTPEDFVAFLQSRAKRS